MAAHLLAAEPFGGEERNHAHPHQPDKAGHHGKPGKQPAGEGGKIMPRQLPMKQRLQQAEHKQRGHRQIIALVAAAHYGHAHIPGRKPIERHARDTAGQGKRCGKGKRARQQPQQCQHHQRRAPSARLFRPGGYRREQEGHHDGAGITPNHFVGMPKVIGQRGRALIAEAPQQDGQCAVEGGQRIEGAEGHAPNRMVFGEQIHDVSMIGL